MGLLRPARTPSGSPGLPDIMSPAASTSSPSSPLDIPRLPSRSQSLGGLAGGGSNGACGDKISSSSSSATSGGGGVAKRMPPRGSSHGRLAAAVRSSGALRSTGSLLSAAADVPGLSHSSRGSIGTPPGMQADERGSSGGSAENTDGAAGGGASSSSVGPARGLLGGSASTSERPSNAARPKTRKTAGTAIVAPTPPLEKPPQIEDYGLTPASLMHLRRRCETLSEERERHLAEIARLLALLNQQQDNSQQEKLAAASNEAQEEAREARELSSMQSARISALEGQLDEIRSCLERSDAEVSKLRTDLREQRRASEDALEAQRQEAKAAAETAEALAREALASKADREGQDQELRALEKECNDLRRKTAEGEASAKEATDSLQDYKRRIDGLRTQLVANSVKLQLHICIPEVSLVFNEAPPMTINMATGLSREFMQDFVGRHVLPQLKPLWLCLDGVDKAPDGTNEKTYSKKVLGLFTNAVEEFVVGAKQGKEEKKGMDDGRCRSGSKQRPLSGSGSKRPLFTGSSR